MAVQAPGHHLQLASDAGPASLKVVLDQAGWSARQLVRGVNAWLGAHGQSSLRLDETAAYSWLRQGYCPRPPIPGIVATVLGEHLGINVSAKDLWPGRVDRPDLGTLDHRALNAVAGVADADGPDGTLQALVDLTGRPTDGRLGVMAVTGETLQAAVAHVTAPGGRGRRISPKGELVSSAQVDVIAAHVAALRRLDDQHGGGATSLRYAAAELRAVLDLKLGVDPDSMTGRRFMGIVVDLAQLVGWMHFDAGRCGDAERYLLLGAHLAHSVGERDRLANTIGMIAYVSAFAGHGREATRIAEAGLDACRPGSPVVRARMLGRLATAAAADGDLPRFRSTSAQAMAILAGHNGTVPSFLYYLEPAQLRAESGQALVTLAGRRPDVAEGLLNEAVELLTPISGVGQRPEYPRSALLHATFLTEAHLRLGHLEEAAAAARSALSRLDVVGSGRGRTYLASLIPAFARRHRSSLVGELLPDLHRALTRP